MREGEAANSTARRGLFSFATPLAICLPCLRPFILAAVLIGAGVGSVVAVSSKIAFLLEILTALAMLVVFVIGLGVARLVHCRGGGIRNRSLNYWRRIVQEPFRGMRDDARIRSQSPASAGHSARRRRYDPSRRLCRE